MLGRTYGASAALELLFLLRSTCTAACMLHVRVHEHVALLDATISPYRPLGLGQFMVESLWRLSGALPATGWPWLALSDAKSVK